MNTPARVAHPLLTLSVALVFAAIFLFGGQIATRLGPMGLRRFLSFAAGISLAYTFVHVLPALGAIQDLQTEHPTGFYRLFPEYSVYLWTMAGFLIFSGLETMAARSHGDPMDRPSHESDPDSWQRWVHIGGFALYAWVLTYFMMWTGKGFLAVGVFAVAMGVHLFPITCGLREHYQAVYHRGGSFLLALGALAGWVCGMTLRIPRPVLFNLVAIVAGGVIVNSAIAELPKEKEGKFGFFLTGAVVYAALLLTLSHFEHGE